MVNELDSILFAVFLQRPNECSMGHRRFRQRQRLQTSLVRCSILFLIKGAMNFTPGYAMSEG
jgi:hypothetical protein